MSQQVETVWPVIADRAAVVEQACGATMATLRVARSLVGAGRPIDLSGLEHCVGALCAQALDLDPPAGRALRPCLASLLAELDRLTTEYRAASNSSA